MEITSQFLEISTLDLKPEMAESTIKLIESSFEYSQQNNFARDFYPLVTKENWQNCHIVIDKEKNIVISFIGALYREMCYQEIMTPVCLLGGISVHQEYRGRGIFKFFIDNILSRLEKNCSLFILWSGEPSLYLKSGFHLTGEQFEIQGEDDSDLKRFTKTKLINLSSKEIGQIKNIYRDSITKNFMTIKRSEEDWDVIKNITSADLYINYNEKGNISEYFFANKGEDLNQIIYESSFLLTEKYKNFLPLKIWSPIKTRAQALAHFNCMIRPGSNVHFQKFVQELSRNMINIIELSVEHNVISFYFKGDTISIGINDFLCGLLGPGQFKEIQQFLPKMFISGLDSI
jgi:predicted N-acetyltransferase YhbS